MVRASGASEGELGISGCKNTDDEHVSMDIKCRPVDPARQAGSGKRADWQGRNERAIEA